MSCISLLMKKKSVIFRPLIDTQLFVSACDSFPDKYTQSMLVCPVIIFDLLSDVDFNRNYFKISAEKISPLEIHVLGYQRVRQME